MQTHATMTSVKSSMTPQQPMVNQYKVKMHALLEEEEGIYVFFFVFAGGTSEESDRPSGSGSSEESGFSAQKRARKDGHGRGMFDLNLPADV